MKNKLITIGTMLLGSFLIILFFYKKSNTNLYRDNPFIRVFPPHPYSKWTSVPISVGLRLVGQTTNHIYLTQLGKYNSYTKINLRTLDSSSHQLHFPRSITLAWSVAQMTIDSSGIYLYEGLTPTLFFGKPNKPMNKSEVFDSLSFAQSFPINPHSFVSVMYDSVSQQNILALIKLNSHTKVTPKPELLTKQLDGVFCTYGEILKDPVSEKIIYLYKYRNTFLIMDSKLNLIRKGSTIDTISRVQLNVDSYQKGKQVHYAFSAPPLVVNKSAAIYNNVLYVNSALKAKNEKEENFSKYTVIDVYSLKDSSYRYSFRLPHIQSGKVKSFIVQDNILIAQYQNELGIFYLDLPELP